MSARPPFSLEGKVAIVTGASSGIGSAIAEAMSQAGAKVVLVGRDEERLQRCAERCGEHRVAAVDQIADDAPARIVSETLSAFGGVDSIVHSAGIFWPNPLGDAPLGDFDMQWQVNVRAPYALTQSSSRLEAFG